MIYLYYAPVLSLFLHSISVTGQLCHVAELSSTGAPLFDFFFDPRCNLYGTIVMDVFFKHEVLFQSRLAFELVSRYGSSARAAAHFNACVLSALAAVTHSSSICCFTINL